MRGVAVLLLIVSLALVLALGGALYTGYESYTLQGQLATSTAQNVSLADELSRTRADNEELSQQLADEVARNTDFATQLGDLSHTVGNLTKLSQTDKELLKKYSRVYFLNENYIPQALATVTPAYTLEPSRTYKVHAKMEPFLERMLEDAEANGTPLVVLSAYRSFGQQAQLKSSYTFTYGSGSNRFSADQGYSEHQLGTAVDVTTKSLGALSLTFLSTPAGIWLTENAYKYGFILSYPKGNTYYQFEPWHWRFVGVNLATRLHQDNESFYDLTQRDIDQYLISIFNDPNTSSTSQE